MWFWMGLDVDVDMDVDVVLDGGLTRGGIEREMQTDPAFLLAVEHWTLKGCVTDPKAIARIWICQ